MKKFIKKCIFKFSIACKYIRLFHIYAYLENQNKDVYSSQIHLEKSNIYLSWQELIDNYKHQKDKLFWTNVDKEINDIIENTFGDSVDIMLEIELTIITVIISILVGLLISIFLH